MSSSCENEQDGYLGVIISAGRSTCRSQVRMRKPSRLDDAVADRHFLHSNPVGSHIADGQSVREHRCDIRQGDKMKARLTVARQHGLSHGIRNITQSRQTSEHPRLIETTLLFNACLYLTLKWMLTLEVPANKLSYGERAEELIWPCRAPQ